MKLGTKSAPQNVHPIFLPGSGPIWNLICIPFFSLLP